MTKKYTEELERGYSVSTVMESVNLRNIWDKK